jgi:tetratricopeptide (TPR) repeat protein
MGRASRGLLLTLVLFAAFGCCFAEQLAGGRGVWGWIRVGQDRVPNQWAQVRLYNSSRALQKEVKTDSAGSFALGVLSPGDYYVEVTLPGYETVQQPINVLGPSQQPLLIVLQPSGSAKPGSGFLDARVPVAAREQFEKAEEQLRANHPDRARKHLEKAVKTYEDFAAAHRRLAQLALDRDKLDEAEAHLNRAMLVDPENPDGLELQGALCNRRNQPDQAVAVLEKSLKKSAYSWRAHFELARAYFALKSFARALPYARKAMEDRNVAFPEGHVLLGNILMNLRQYPEAARQFSTFLKLAPGSPSAEPARKVLEQMQAAGLTQ